MAGGKLRWLLLAVFAGHVAASDWPAYGGDAGGRHYSALNQINRDNVARLEVALDLASGALRWDFQHVRHDLWDYDTPAQPILFDWQRNGQRVPALAQLTKQGFVFVLNRLTGESLWEITEQPVPPSQIPGEITARTQPKPIAPPPSPP